MKAFFNKINLFNCKTLPRKVFTFYFITTIIGAILLMLPISRISTQEPFSFINALFTVSSAFSNTGLTLYNTGTYFTLFGQIIILLLIQIGGLGLMTLKVMIFLFLGKKIGFKDSISATNERGDGKDNTTLDIIKTAVIGILSIELLATILFSLRYYFAYFDNPIFNQNIFNVIYQGLFAAVSATNNAGIDILGGNSLEMFSKDYFIQTVTVLCLIIGGLGFPLFYDLKNYITCKKNKTKFHLSYFSKFIIRIYFSISIISIIALLLTELSSGTLLYDESIPLLQRISHIVFTSFSARSAGYYTINVNEFAEGSKIILSLLMWIGSAPASTGGGVRITTFFICILAIISYSKNKKEVTFLKRRIPEDTVTRSLVILFLSQILILVSSIIIVSSLDNVTFLEAYFETCSAFGVAGLSLGITSSLNTICKLLIILLMFTGQLGISNALLMWSSDRKSTQKTILPEQDILIN